MKKSVAYAFALVLAATPTIAEEHDGKSLMEKGAELFFEGLRKEMEPKLDELRAFADTYGPAMKSFIEEMGPAFMDMVDEVKDWTRYYPPEMLPNGDIIIRKKPDPEGGDKPQDDPGEKKSTDL